MNIQKIPASEARAINKAHFDRVAPQYGTYGDWLSFESRIVAPYVSRLAVGAMLDLGAGTGNTIAAVTQHAEVERVVAVDCSDRMLAELQQQPLSAQVTLEMVHSDIADFLGTPKDDRFDLITSFGAFEFVPDLPEVLGHLSDHLEPGGHAFFTYEPLMGNISRCSEPVTVCEQAGFVAHRYDPQEISSVIHRQGLTVETEYEAAAYSRDGLNVPYVFVWATKPE
ncbi:MAG TPA: class I SAM-dependent methyltransferase [Candidatus Saccharimonadales bacterium]|nr:class I SAM-dependent methyltransferase [Candidatus Saccharimonadales bacterium]